MQRMNRVLAALALVVLSAPFFTAAVAQDPPQEEEVLDESGEGKTITFYPHVFGLGVGQPMPGNTQFPFGDEDFSIGSPGTGCGPYPVTGDPAGLLANCDGSPAGNSADNVLYVYSTAGFVDMHRRVEYDPDGDGVGDYSKFHNERGQAKDILLDTAKDITSTFYMSADWHPWFVLFCEQQVPRGLPMPTPCWNWDPGAYTDWQVEATLFLASMGEYQGQASDPPPVHEKVMSGDVVEVAKGVSDPVQLISLDENLPGGQQTVYEIGINLGKPKVDKIPKELDWIMRYRWWSNTAAGKALIPLNWNINSGEFYPNRFSVPVENPFNVELVFPQFIHEKLLVHAIMNSPWGSYDVDPKTVQLTIADAQGVTLDAESVTQLSDYSVAHGGHYKPVNVTWIWDYKADGLAPGVYTATVDACNWQHSACGTVSSIFKLDAKGLGSTVQVGRSGVATFTQEQLKKVQEAAEKAAAGEALIPAGNDEVVETGAPADKKTPGPEIPAVLGAVALIAVSLRRKSP